MPVLHSNRKQTRVYKEIFMKPYINALHGEDIFYPSKNKVKLEPLAVPDEIHGYLQPILYRLNQGKTIAPKSQEHKALKELVERMGNS